MSSPHLCADCITKVIEDSDFFKVYGNPVLVRSKEGREYDCVIMSIHYYERLKNIATKD